MTEPLPRGARGGRDPWDRMQGEPRNAYRAFEVYRNMGPKDRGQLAAYRIYAENPNAVNTSTDYKQWRKKFDWDGRADAWDDEVSRTRRKAQLDGMRLEAMRIGEEQESLNRKYIEAAQASVKKAMEILSMDLSELSERQWNLGHVSGLLKAAIALSDVVSDAKKAVEENTEEGEANKALEYEIARLAGGQDTGGAA